MVSRSSRDGLGFSAKEEAQVYEVLEMTSRGPTCIGEIKTDSVMVAHFVLDAWKRWQQARLDRLELWLSCLPIVFIRKKRRK